MLLPVTVVNLAKNTVLIHDDHDRDEYHSLVPRSDVTDQCDPYTYLGIDTSGLSDTQTYVSGMKTRLLGRLGPLRAPMAKGMSFNDQIAKRFYLLHEGL